METTPTSLRKRKLLIVDDDPNCRHLLRSLLEHAGYEVSVAQDGAEGYERVVAERPDIIITDWMMPRVDGLEMIRKIRAQLNWYPYILLVTCKTDQQLGLDMGADDFVLKPIRREQLLPRIRAGERIVTLQERLREKNLELNLVNQQLAELAITDPLSGLLNRRAFFEEARNEWHRATRYDLALSCLMIDIDRFKSVNDTYGHAIGDRVIRGLSSTLRTGLRENDVLCRYGGEEFCALLINTPIETAAELAERLRKRAHEVRVPGLPDSFQLSISLGVASRCLQTSSEQTLIDQADQALLFAKRTGRDRWSRFDQLGTAQLAEAAEWVDDSRSEPAADQPGISFQLVNSLLETLAYRDAPAVAHSQRVARLCEQFGRHLGMKPTERLVLEITALLHEIGRLAMSDRDLTCLDGSNRQDDLLHEQLRQRTLEIVGDSFPESRLAETLSATEAWYDGSSGEPHGEAIPRGARILAIASYYDGLTNGRDSGTTQSRGASLERLRQQSGQRFDPQLVESFCAMLTPQSLATTA